MQLLEVNNKPAVKIFGRKLSETQNSYLFDCEGDKVWLPKSTVKIIDKETILVQEWIYKQKFDE